MTPREKAEAYVRGKLPELMELSFGCEVVFAYDQIPFYWVVSIGVDRVTVTNGTGNTRVVPLTTFLEGKIAINKAEIIGHPIQLQHWLRVIGEKEQVSSRLTAIASNGCIYKNGTVVMQFNLTTGQPATEADYQAFNDIVGA